MGDEELYEESYDWWPYFHYGLFMYFGAVVLYGSFYFQEQDGTVYMPSMLIWLYALMGPLFKNLIAALLVFAGLSLHTMALMKWMEQRKHTNEDD